MYLPHQSFLKIKKTKQFYNKRQIGHGHFLIPFDYDTSHCQLDRMRTFLLYLFLFKDINIFTL